MRGPKKNQGCNLFKKKFKSTFQFPENANIFLYGPLKTLCSTPDSQYFNLN